MQRIILSLLKKFKQLFAPLQVRSNAQTVATELQQLGYKIVSGGTDNHLVLVDLKQSPGGSLCSAFRSIYSQSELETIELLSGVTTLNTVVRPRYADFEIL